MATLMNIPISRSFLFRRLKAGGIILIGFHKMQNNRFVQLKLSDSTYFNVQVFDVKNERGYIVKKLR
jgi:hypothetical protein